MLLKTINKSAAYAVFFSADTTFALFFCSNETILNYYRASWAFSFYTFENKNTRLDLSILCKSTSLWILLSDIFRNFYKCIYRFNCVLIIIAIAYFWNLVSGLFTFHMSSLSNLPNSAILQLNFFMRKLCHIYCIFNRDFHLRNMIETMWLLLLVGK